MSPSRRAVLVGLGGVAVGGVVGWRLLDDGDDEAAGPTTATAAPPDPASSLGDALVAVGARYLEDHPDEADVDVLLAELPALDGTVPDRPGQDLGVLADQAAADDVVELDGWVLSVTECRAAALYAV